MAVLGLRYDDFCKLTFEEFGAAVQAYERQELRRSRDAWQRMRMHAAITLQPHVKKKVTPRDLIHFPWEDENPKSDAPKLTMAERRARATARLAKFEARQMTSVNNDKH